MENQQEESKNELLKQFHAHQQEISSLKERISLLEFETQNISTKTNPNKSKILQLVERARFLYDEQKKQLQEIEKQIQKQKELDLMSKQTKKKILKQSINDAVKFAQEHLKEEKKIQAQELKHIQKKTQNIIEQNKNVHLSEKQHRNKTIKDQESKSLQNVRHYFHDKKEKLANVLSVEKMKIKNEVEKQSSELQNLEQLEMRYLMRLKLSKLQEQAFKNQMKDAYEMRVEDYAKKYKKNQK